MFLVSPMYQLSNSVYLIYQVYIVWAVHFSATMTHHFAFLVAWVLFQAFLLLSPVRHTAPSAVKSIVLPEVACFLFFRLLLGVVCHITLSSWAWWLIKTVLFLLLYGFCNGFCDVSPFNCLSSLGLIRLIFHSVSTTTSTLAIQPRCSDSHFVFTFIILNDKKESLFDYDAYLFWVESEDEIMATICLISLSSDLHHAVFWFFRWWLIPAIPK